MRAERDEALGHDKVSALDGGLPRWIAEGEEVEVGETADWGETEYAGSDKVDSSYVKCMFFLAAFVFVADTDGQSV